MWARCRSDCAADSERPGVRYSCATLLAASSFSNEPPYEKHHFMSCCGGHAPHTWEQPYCSVRIEMKHVSARNA